MNAPLEESKPKVSTFISDFTPPIPSYKNKPFEMDPIVKVSRPELSAFDTKHSDKSGKGTDVGGLQRGKSRVTFNDLRGASGTEFPTMQDIVGHPNCNSINDALGKTNSASRHKNEYRIQEAVNGGRIEKLSKGLLHEWELEHYALGSSSTKVPEHGIVCHKPRDCKHKNNFESVGSTVKLSKRLSSNYELRKCLCDCSAEGKTNLRKPHRSRGRTGIGRNNRAVIGSAVKEPMELISDFKLEQHLNGNDSAVIAKDETDVATLGDSHEAEQKKRTCMPKSNNQSIQKEMQHSRADIDDTPYHCDRCRKRYATSRGLQDHYVFHTGARPFVCKVCAEMFPTLIKLVKHSHTHKRGQAYECQLCDKKFRFLLSLKRHILFHTGERPYECVLCNKRFFTLPHLKNHIHIHTGEKPFVCRLCWKGFSSRAGLGKHRFHHARGEPYSCRFCSSQFRRYRLFMKHIRTHETRKYECSVCCQVFASLPLIRKHARTHSPVRPYTCTLCRSGFSNSTSLILHYRSHRRSEHLPTE
jgi:KRAB domain-containing zinc finger protein